MKGKRKNKIKIPRWKTASPPFEIGKDGFLTKDIIKDKQGWVDALIFRPFPYDLVSMQTEKRIKSGWWNGVHWEGLRLADKEKVLYWKAQMEN